MESDVIEQSVKKMLNKLKACFNLSKKYTFYSVDVDNFAMHELQIELKKLLKNLNYEEKKQVYEDFKYTLNEFYKDAIIYKAFDNKDKSGFIIMPTENIDMNVIHQYTITILENNDDIIA